MRIMISNKVIIWLWSFVWRHWLDKDDRVVYVCGWRNALVDRPSGRMRITPIFNWEWKLKKRFNRL